MAAPECGAVSSRALNALSNVKIERIKEIVPKCREATLAALGANSPRGRLREDILLIDKIIDEINRLAIRTKIMNFTKYSRKIVEAKEIEQVQRRRTKFKGG